MRLVVDEMGLTIFQAQCSIGPGVCYRVFRYLVIARLFLEYRLIYNEPVQKRT